MNIVVLEGTLSSAPRTRTLPSGDVLGTYEVTTRSGDGSVASVPVVWFDPPGRAATLDAGAAVVVAGVVRRRFYRTPAGTRSRTEVGADVVHPLTHRVRIERLFSSAIDKLDDRRIGSASR